MASLLRNPSRALVAIAGLVMLALLLGLAPLRASAQAAYYPDATWQHKTPAETGIDAALLKEAIDFAVANEIRNPRDLKLNHYQTFGREPFGHAIGPIKDRGPETGIVVHKGYVVAEWGEPARVDMAHSITKSMLSSVIGVAVDRGMIRSIHDGVHEYVPPILPYNAMPAGNIPVGTIVHNIELKIGKGGQIARSAGSYAQIVGRDGEYVILRLNSGEQRLVHGRCMATIGAVSNPDNMNTTIGKAGRQRWKGRMPHNRGITMNPVDHPHGGRTKGGKHWVTPWGKPTKGAKTRKNKRTTKFILVSRHDRKKKQQQ